MFKFYSDEKITKMRRLHIKAKDTKVGNKIICPMCEKENIKTTWNKIFCSKTKNKDCSSRYRNIVDPNRRNVALLHAAKTGKLFQ